jgi:filamentous hemagglutinin family protein
LTTLLRPAAPRSPSRLTTLLGTAALVGLIGAAGSAIAAPVLPTGGSVAAGAASIGASSASRLTIDQSTSKAVINWSSFSIGQGGQVQINNGAGATLNRVLSGGALSQIDGTLSATGSVFLLNPNGVIVGKSGVVSTGGSFVGSTLGVKDSQFMAGGDLAFAGASGAGVLNNGLIVSASGDIALIGAQVTNNGTLQAPQGDVALGAGHEIVLHDQDLDDGKLAVTVGGSDTSATNAGLIEAASAELRANGGNVYALAVNPGAHIAATGVSTKDGNVYLVAEGGSVSATGEIDAHHADGTGGLVETSGATVNFNGLQVYAGKWLVDPINLTVDAAAASTIDANLANVDVELQTTATTASGPGLQSSGAGDININAPIGWSSFHQLTLDAYHSININAPISVQGNGTLNMITSDGGAGGDYILAPGVNISFTQNAGGNLFINGNFYQLLFSESDLPVSDNSFNDNFLFGNYAVGQSFSLNGQLYSHAPMTGYFGTQYFGTFAGLGNTISDLNINQTIADVQFSNNGIEAKGFVGLFGTIGFGSVVRDLTLSNVFVHGGDGMAVGAVAGFNGGTISNVTVSGVVLGGDSTNDGFGQLQAYAGGLAGVNGGTITGSSSSATVSAGVAIAGGLAGITLANTTISNSSASGDVSVGDDLLGERNVAAGGLVGEVGADSSDQAILTGDSATGEVDGGQQAFVGGLAGFVTGGALSTDFATGFVSGGAGSYAGGLVGSVDNSSITASYATGAVSQFAAGLGGAPDRIGGFAGYIGNGASVSQSYASGAVTAISGPDSGDATLAGGFAGDVDFGQVTNSYALGSASVSGGSFATTGGFVGLVEDGASVQAVYATGAVSGTGQLRGLAGQIGNAADFDSSGSITNAYWDEGTTGQTTGFTLSGAGVATSVTAIGGASGHSPYAQASYGAFGVFGANWTMLEGETRPLLKSEYSTTIDSAHQLQLMYLDPTAHYVVGADIDVSEDASTSGIWNPTNGFVTIAGTVAAPFTGSFDGGGHTLSNLTISQPAGASQTLDGYAHNGFAGLFGVVGAAGSIKNVNLVNATVTGGDGMLVGLVAGAVEGTVSGVTTAGTAHVGNDLADPTHDGTGYASVGGLAGDAGFTGSISNSSSSATVIGGVAAAGGLVGALRSGATVNNGSASGDVTVAGGVSGGNVPQAGGLVGVVNGFQFTGVSPILVNISGSNATGTVNGGSFSSLGGLVGSANKGAITTSFATGAVSSPNDSFSGGLVGLAVNTTIGNSFATGSVTQTSASVSGAENVSGGFIGDAGTATTITGSWSSGATLVHGSGAAPAMAGGFVGAATPGATLTRDYSLGGAAIGTAATGDLVGGFAATDLGAVISDFYATGLVSAPSGAATEGGLIGTLGPGTTASTGYWDEGTTTRVTPIGQNLGTATKLVGVGGTTGLSPYAQASYANFNFTADWVLIEGETRPIQRSEYSTSITNAHQLQLMTLDPTATYALLNDVDAIETSSATGLWNSANGFVPVGSNLTQAFSGTFNGDGFTIANLTITDIVAAPQTLFSGQATNGTVGLFGAAGPTSVLENVNLANVNILAGNGMVSGALVGSTDGLVANATSSGTVDPAGPSLSAVGGLVGDLGDGGSAGMIVDSSSSATVTGGFAYVGGLVGWAHAGSTIQFSSASGDVTTGGNANQAAAAGGLIGAAIGDPDNPVNFTQDFATGTVTGGEGAAVGGFAGILDGVNVFQSYATGDVSQGVGGFNVDDAIGGFVGFMGAGTIQTAFASGNVTATGSDEDGETAGGGFVGRLSGGQITDAYASGSVTGDNLDSELGGFAGEIDSGGSLNRILATGLVSGGRFDIIGGVVGELDSGSITAAYWDGGTTDQANPAGQSFGFIDATEVGDDTGVDPFDPNSYPELDFTRTWSIPSGSALGNGGPAFYPELYSVSHVLKEIPGDASWVYGTFPTVVTELIGLQGRDEPEIVSSVTASVTGATLSSAGFYDVGTDTIVINVPLFRGGVNGSSGNYRVIRDPNTTAELDITPRDLNPQQQDTAEKVYDTTTDAVLSGNDVFLSNTVPFDDIALTTVPLTGQYDNPNAGANKLVTASGYAIGGADVGNYNLIDQSNDFIGTIDPAPLTISAVTDTKTYDGTTTSTGVPTVSGLLGDDDATDLAQEFDSRNAGSRSLNVTNYTIEDGNGGGNYAVTLESADGQINPAFLTISAAPDEKIYDGTVASSATPSVSGLVSGDTVTDLTQVFDSKNAGSRSLNVSGFTINDGNGGANYNISTTDQDGQIDPAPLTIAATPQTRVYDGTTTSSATPSVTGLISGDTIDGLVQEYDSRNAGARTLAVQDFTLNDGNDGANYTVSVLGAAGAITPAPLTIAAAPDNKVYDGTTTSAGTPTAAGLFDTDSVTGLSQVFDSKNAGARTLDATDFVVNDGNGGANYDVSVVSAAGSITPAPLTIAAAPDTKVYDGGVSSSATATIAGLVAGDSVTTLAELFDSKNAGARTLAVTGFTINDGNGGANYSVSTSTAAGAITPKPISAALVGPVEKTYDGNTVAPVTAGDLALQGVIGGDAVGLNLSQPGVYATRNAKSGIGVTVNGLSISGADAANYRFTDGASAPVGLIDPALLTITSTPDNKLYDGNAVSTGTPTVSGLVSGDNTTSITQAFDSKNAGDRTLVVSGFTIADGNGGANYKVSVVSASGTITPAPLTLTAAPDSKTYDGTTSSTGTPTATGLIAGDTLSGLSQAFDSKNAGERTLNATGFTIADGNGGRNYAVQLVGADGLISPRPLTVTLVGTVFKVFDGTTVATLTSNNYELGPTLAGDVVLLAAPTIGSYDTPLTGFHKQVTVTGLLLGGADAANYVTPTTEFADIGIITPVLPIEPQIVTQPPQIASVLATLSQQSLSFAGLAGSPFYVFMVFPVGDDDQDKGPGDNLPITGAGNGDLWEGSNLDHDRNKP